MWHCKQYSFFSKLGLYMFAQSPIAPKICTSKFLSFARTWGGSCAGVREATVRSVSES